MKRIKATLAWGLVFALVATFASACKTKYKEWPDGMRNTTASGAAADVRAAKGNVVLFVLYAAWCTGCRKEIPDADRLGVKYAGDGLKVLAFSLDEDPQDYGEMLATRPLKLPLARISPIDTRDLAALVNGLGGSYTDSIPYAALLNREGKMVAEWRGDAADPAELEAKIRPLL